MEEERQVEDTKKIGLKKEDAIGRLKQEITKEQEVNPTTNVNGLNPIYNNSFLLIVTE